MNDNVSTCTFEVFFERHLPSSEIALDAVIGDLKKQKMLVSRGRSLHQTPSSSTHKSSFSHTFKAFKTLFRSGNAKPSRVMKTLQSVGNAVRKALGRIENREVNSCAIRLQDDMESTAHGCITSNLEDPLHATDVVAPIVGIDSSNVHLSSTQIDFILFSRVAQIMNKDARRRFCFAVTFKDSNVSLWWFTRSLTLKSTPFDMIEHPDLLIRLLVFVLGSQKHLLGYDPLVTLLPDRNYVYEIPFDGHAGPLYYRTINLICDSEPAFVSGRRLRVWEVQQVESVANPVRVPGTPNRVLKDVILNAAVRTEADIQEELFADIAKLAQDESWASRPLLNDFPKRDLDVLADALEGDEFKRYFSCIIAKHVGDADEVSGHFPSPTSSSEDSPPRSKRRCIFIYEHVCTALNNISTLGEAVDILKQTLIPLRLMFLAGWVHRDISPGNILVYREERGSPWTVKLSDLEHARRFPDPETPVEDRVTGTPYFIAYEVLDAQALLPSKAVSYEDLSYEFLPIVHNYQHDLESIFWILLWLISMRVNETLPRVFGKMYFQQRVDSNYAALRHRALTHSLFYHLELMKSLPQPLRCCTFFNHLDSLRDDLHLQYVARNRDKMCDDLASYSWMVSHGINAFFDDVEAIRSEWAHVELMVDWEPRSAFTPHPPQESDAQVASPPPSQRQNVASSNKRQAADTGEEGRARKRSRPNPDRIPVIVSRRSGPVTRSMAKSEGRITRSTTRRLQEEEKRKQRRLK
ncbi:other/FunK1 protein kinase [Coprinopsis cinerea AmutBmut pab1-1]|nr:other/FunK1 protein kinase [Coprinopsis cinerea AmutBmut pab1-1]